MSNEKMKVEVKSIKFESGRFEIRGYLPSEEDFYAYSLVLPIIKEAKNVTMFCVVSSEGLDESVLDKGRPYGLVFDVSDKVNLLEACLNLDKYNKEFFEALFTDWFVKGLEDGFKQIVG